MVFLDKCSPDDKYVCKNGGTCNITETGDVKCACIKQYEGETCELGEYIHYLDFIIYH